MRHVHAKQLILYSFAEYHLGANWRRGDFRKEAGEMSCLAMNVAHTRRGLPQSGKNGAGRIGEQFPMKSRIPLATQAKLLRSSKSAIRTRGRHAGRWEIDVAGSWRLRIKTYARVTQENVSRRPLLPDCCRADHRSLPLSDRGDDVFLLAEHFLERFRREFRKPKLKLSSNARTALMSILARKYS